jgi:hypothetical protein
VSSPPLRPMACAKMNKRPILRRVHLVDPASPEGNLSVLVPVHVVFDAYGQEQFLCQECRSDKCEHCGVVYDDLVKEGVLHA